MLITQQQTSVPGPVIACQCDGFRDVSAGDLGNSSALQPGSPAAWQSFQVPGGPALLGRLKCRERVERVLVYRCCNCFRRHYYRYAALLLRHTKPNRSVYPSHGHSHPGEGPSRGPRPPHIHRRTPTRHPRPVERSSAVANSFWTPLQAPVRIREGIPLHSKKLNILINALNIAM